MSSIPDPIAVPKIRFGIEFAVRRDGSMPANEFFAALDTRTKTKLLANLKQVRGMSLIEEFAKDPENHKLLQQETLLLDVAALIHRAMKKRKINRTRLAELLGVTKGRVSQYLGGERNLTLRTLADIFTALGEQLELSTCRISNVADTQAAKPKNTIVTMPTNLSTEGPRHASPHDSN